MKKRRIILATAALLAGTAAFAVLNERTLGQTLAVLRNELGSQNARMEKQMSRERSRRDSQHSDMVKLIDRTNELGLMLYSQNQDYTFDVTYSLRAATREFEAFNKKSMPFNRIVENLDMEIDRYERLIESLKRIPPAVKDAPDLPDSTILMSDSLLRMHLADTSAHRHHPRTGGPPPMMFPPHSPDSSGRPTALDSLEQADRDSCLLFATNLLAMYKSQKMQVVADSTHYNNTYLRLKEANDYAQNRYKSLQKSIFLDGQDNILRILKAPARYARRAIEEATDKYDTTFGGYSSGTRSDWRGPIVTWFIIYVLLYLLLSAALSAIAVRIFERHSEKSRTEEYRQRRPVIILLIAAIIFTVTVIVGAIFVEHNFFREASKLLLIFSALLIAILSSLLVHMDADKVRGGIKLYMPIILLGLAVITFRIIFIPNRLVNLILTPILAVFIIWQAILVKKQRRNVKNNDIAYSGATLFIMAATLVMAMAGYVLMGVQVLIWWLFQLTALCALTAVHDLMDRYEQRYIVRKLQGEGKHITKQELARGEFITHTWLFDFVKMAVVPAFAVVSIPLCVIWAAGVFDLTSLFRTLLSTVFYSIPDSNGNVMLKLSADRIFAVVALFYFFRYFAYAGKAFYKQLRVNKFKKENKVDYVRDTDINFTLANNVIGIIVWAGYIVMFIMVFKIPVGSLSVIFAGLAAGLGLALKDVLNNFIYGMQLMSGRLRVGDKIECDGIRGVVSNITYQSTTIESETGALIAFTNTTLFNKNFKNLTRKSHYEYVPVTVGVAYGTDVEKARQVILDALKDLAKGRDKYGNLHVEPKYGIQVSLDSFGDSSVNLKVKHRLLVEQRYAFVAREMELIYKALNENGITIPFPQRDIHIIKDE